MDKKDIKEFQRFFEDKNYLKLKNSIFNYLNRKRLIKFYSKKYLQNGPYLDIGCGISPVSPLIDSKTIFIDFSRNAVEYLKKSGYNAKYGSVTKIPLKTQSVANLFCSEVLEHVKDYKKALEEIARVLINGGHSFITVPCWQKYWNVDDEFVGHYRRFEPYNMVKEIEKTGMKVINTYPVGSKLERALTVFLVKRFSNNSKLNPALIPLYKIVNYILSWAVTMAGIFSSKKNASVILFISKKSRNS